MNRILLILVSTLLFFITRVYAQKQAGSAELPGTVPSHSAEKLITDTLFHDFFSLNPVLYTSPTGGWMNGTNGYGDEEKAQEIKFTQTYLLQGFIYWFALKKKTTGGDTSSVIFKMYRKDSADWVHGQLRLVPGTVLAADTVRLADIQAGISFEDGLNYFALPQPVVMHNNYLGAFSMALMHPADSIALFGSTDGQVHITDYSWEKWNGRWNTIKNAWTLDIDFAIFPVIDLTGASVSESESDKIHIFPNPVQDFIQWETKGQLSYDRYVIMNAEGKVIQSGSSGSFQTGLDVSTLPGGYYLLGLHDSVSKNTRFFRFLKK